MLIENAAEKPTYPMYNNGGCIAKAGSCNKGLKPKPSGGIGEITSKGFEVINENNKKPIMINA
jgi:hypothetical protein